MKKIIALMSVVLLAGMVSAQNPMMNRRQQGGQMQTGHFYGKVVDPSNKPVEAASVTLVTSRMDSATQQTKDVVVGGMLTGKKGDFSIENVPVMGRYKLKITGIGFKSYEKAVAFDMPNREAMSNAGNDPTALLGATDKDLGNIKVEVDEKVLGTVVVSTTRSALTLGIDRKIFNVDKNITSAGGTAIDVMKNVPSVNVDIDGNVTLRNAAPTIFVDGRPTTLTLDQIPADAIESVEIITNPSAKFDASGGTAGILNVVMKKNRRVGYSGNLRANIDSRAKFGLGGDVNMRQNKVNVFASGQVMQRKSVSTGTTIRTQPNYTNNKKGESQQNDKSVGGGTFGFGRFGFDYFMDIRNTLTVTGSLSRGKMSPTGNSTILIDSLLQGNNTPYYMENQQRNSTTDNIFRNKGAQVSYKHNFPQNGHEWTADLTYNEGNNENNGNIVTNYFNNAGATIRSPYNQLQNGSSKNDNLTIQTDYSNPISENSKLEAGARMQRRNINSSNTITIAGKNNVTLYNSTDNVYAAYSTFSNRIKNFGYQLGLRVESSDYQGTLPNKGQTFKTQFPISLFPSVFLSQKIGADDDLQFNYSRRINRPSFFQLFPFTDYSDSLNISHGNPALKPEFTNSFELSYSKVFKNRDNFLASIYFKNTNNLITRIQALEFDTLFKKDIPTNTYQNANRSYITGLELTSRNKLTKFWDVTANANFFTSKIDLDNQPSPDQFLSYFFKLNNTFKLPMNLSLQLSGDYQSKVISSPGGRGGGGGFGGGGGGGFGGGGGGGFFGGSQSAAQGFIRPNYGVDAAIRYEFLKNKSASLSLNVNDIFRTRKFDQHTETSFFVQDASRRRDAQVVRLNFNYRFGKFDVSLFKRKNTKAENNDETNQPNM